MVVGSWTIPHKFVCCVLSWEDYKNSGIDGLWMKSGLYSDVVCNQIINGSHNNRAMEAHETTLQVFTDVWLSAFFESCKIVYDALIADCSNLKCGLQSGSHEEIKKAYQDLNTAIESFKLKTSWQILIKKMISSLCVLTAEVTFAKL
ncbi:hypothetical protein DPMN_164752 [Dreissena polymorpha]|uniref:Uncharacterized protein n=1 Tax=Dreissena polymorpha TaxID=45954 RepID=A0A9D4EZ43_DREPO|nr:hypothetical protein DPMN_164752 [Dreissena polymorpha]